MESLKSKNVLKLVGLLTLLIGAFYVFSFSGAQKEAMEDYKGLWFALEFVMGLVLILVSVLDKSNNCILRLAIGLLIINVILQVPIIKLCLEQSEIPLKILDAAEDKYFTFYSYYSITNVIVIFLSLLNIYTLISTKKIEIQY